MLHKDTLLGDVHSVHFWEVADAAALTALVPVAADVGKIAFQLDTRDYYILANNTGPVWKQINSLGALLTGLSVAAGTTVLSTHTILQAIGFLQNQATAAVESSGTFTPTIFGSSTAGVNTYSIQTGFYRKRGSVVTVQGRITMTAKDAAMAGDIRIGALPFASLATANSQGSILVGFHSNITYPASKTALAAIVLADTSDISLRWSQSAASMSTVVAADIGAATDIIYGGTYISA